jgi:glucose-1-phosphate adenylyltransferase
VNVGRHARIRRAIVDKYVSIPPGFEVGFDLEKDVSRGFTVSPSGIVVISRNDNPVPESDQVVHMDPQVGIYR